MRLTHILISLTFIAAIFTSSASRAEVPSVSFTSRVIASRQPGAYAITTADFNRDGQLDVAVANYSGNSVTVLLGRGNNAFSSSTYAVGTGPASIMAADLNGDLIKDLIISCYNGGVVSVLRGRDDGSFDPA